MLKRLERIGNTLFEMHQSAASVEEMKAFLMQEGYAEHQIERCVRDLLKLGVLPIVVAESLGVMLSTDEKIKFLQIKRMKGSGSGCAGILLAFLMLMGIAISVA
jgi:hypothetical protein